MTQRRWLLGLMFLGVSLGFAQTAEAQQSGFIIGLGVGPGLASYTTSAPVLPSSDRELVTLLRDDSIAAPD